MSERTGQPTEEPTQRRLEKAFEDGQIAFSTELMGGLIVFAGVLFFLFAGKWFFDTLLNSLRESLLYLDPFIDDPDTIMLAIHRNIYNVGMACIGLMLPLVGVAMLAGAMQTRFNFSTKPLEFKWSKISPQSGIKRLFSTRSLNKGAISILKSIAVVAAAYYITMDHLDEVTVAGLKTFGEMLNLGARIVLEIGLVTALLMVVVGGADLAFQLWKQNKDLMMTKQEVREEQKDNDGDPQIKARIRKLRMEMSKNTIMKEVPKASVVITNPTHFAVAIRYESGETAAPIVIAKGADYLAKQIIQVAKQNGIAVVERKPIARFLYANVKVGREIPFELYKAVAEILNFIRKVKR